MSDWKIVGKGGANVVLRNVDHVNTLLRVPYQNIQIVDSLLDQLIWGPSCNLPLTRCTPLVEDTGTFISYWGHVPLSAEAAACITDVCGGRQPKDGLLMANLVHLPGAAAPISVELKPKCGFLPTAQSIHPDKRFKWQVSRYQLHQQLKYRQGKITRTSGYDPLDLFSEDRARQMQALESLLHDPQNNLCVWGAGEKVDHGDLLTWAAQQTPAMPRVLQGILNCTGVLKCLLEMQRLDEWDIEGVNPLYAHANFHLQEKGVAVCPSERMCEDLDRCWWMTQWRSESMASVKASADDHLKHWHALEALHSLSWAAVQDALRKYCLSVAAKDCSIILSYTVDREGGSGYVRQAPVMDCCACKRDAENLRMHLNHGSTSAAADQVTESGHTCIGSMRLDGHTIHYRLGVVDMDRKSMSKVEYCHALDQDILQRWKECVEISG